MPTLPLLSILICSVNVPAFIVLKASHPASEPAVTLLKDEMSDDAVMAALEAL